MQHRNQSEETHENDDSGNGEKQPIDDNRNGTDAELCDKDDSTTTVIADDDAVTSSQQQQQQQTGKNGGKNSKKNKKKGSGKVDEQVSVSSSSDGLKA